VGVYFTPIEIVMIEASKVNIAEIIEANKLHIQGRSEFIFSNVLHLEDRYTIRINKVSKKSKSSTIKEYVNGKIVYKRR
jgi:hypothetical protein